MAVAVLGKRWTRSEIMREQETPGKCRYPHFVKYFAKNLSFFDEQSPELFHCLMNIIVERQKKRETRRLNDRTRERIEKKREKERARDEER